MEPCGGRMRMPSPAARTYPQGASRSPPIQNDPWLGGQLRSRAAGAASVAYEGCQGGSQPPSRPLASRGGGMGRAGDGESRQWEATALAGPGVGRLPGGRLQAPSRLSAGPRNATACRIPGSIPGRFPRGGIEETCKTLCRMQLCGVLPCRTQGLHFQGDTFTKAAPPIIRRI